MFTVTEVQRIDVQPRWGVVALPTGGTVKEDNLVTKEITQQSLISRPQFIKYISKNRCTKLHVRWKRFKVGGWGMGEGLGRYKDTLCKLDTLHQTLDAICICGSHR